MMMEQQTYIAKPKPVIVPKKDLAPANPAQKPATKKAPAKKTSGKKASTKKARSKRRK